jgi:oligoribonuclease NrnB/cAMP/cGMP phosphodiesterase (DHH superfamily)
MRRPLCIYHGNCADGFGAAWAVWKRFGDSIDYHPGVYGRPPPDVSNRDVIMVDFSYKRDVLAGMLESGDVRQANTILILDHHKTAQEDLGGFEPPDSGGYDPAYWRNLWELWAQWPVRVLFDMERSGAGLAWDFFHPGKPRPKLLDRIEDRDLWRFRLSGSAPLHQLVRSFPDEFSAYDALMERAEHNLESLISEGSAIERKHHKDIAELLGLATRRMVIGGVSVPVANLPYTMASDAGNAMAAGEPFAACYFDRADKRVFSLRSRLEGADVSAVAKLYGGGGHRNAAGFERPIGWEGDQ